MPPVLLPGCPGHSFPMTFITCIMTVFLSVTFPRSWVILPFDEPQPVPDISDYHYCALAMEWSHCSVYKDMRIFTYSTSAISRHWFHSVNSQWRAKAGPACGSMGWHLQGHWVVRLTAPPSDEEKQGLHLAWVQTQLCPLLINSLPWNVGTTLLAWTYQPWEASGWGCLTHGHSGTVWWQFSMNRQRPWVQRGGVGGGGRAGWRLMDSAGAVVGPSMTLQDLEYDAQACLCVGGTPHPAITVMGNWDRDRRLRWSERGDRDSQREAKVVREKRLR